MVVVMKIMAVIMEMITMEIMAQNTGTNTKE
jgi:hypothetical protein